MIAITHLVKYYGSHCALDHLDLQVKPGTVLGLLGANGAGKSTLVAVLNGLSDFQEGEITVFGLPLQENLREIRSRSAFIPQSLALYETLSVQENLSFFAGLQCISGKRKKRNLEYAISVNRLETMLDKRAADLSGGQKQRLNIGIGLLNDPELLYFDEPTAGIDPELRNEILDSISALAASGRTIVYTSHYLSEIEKICDQAAILHNGKIIRQGKLAELLKQDSPTAAVVELSHPLPSSPCFFEQKIDRLRRINATTLMIDQATAARIGQLLAYLEQEKREVKQIHYGANSLESFFLRLTAEEKSNV
jgi:ABC-2 type transport system ATP-binding protein